MANIKSALKRIKVNEKKRQANKPIKSELKTYIKKTRAAIEEGRKEDAQELLKITDKKLSKAAVKNIIHKNAAARNMSKLQKSFNAMAEEANA